MDVVWFRFEQGDTVLCTWGEDFKVVLWQLENDEMLASISCDSPILTAAVVSFP